MRIAQVAVQGRPDGCYGMGKKIAYARGAHTPERTGAQTFVPRFFSVC